MSTEPMSEFELRIMREFFDIARDSCNGIGAQDRYRCARCNDEMDPKFAQVHEPVCECLSLCDGEEVDRLLATSGGGP